jgi:hypothetical protein
MKEATALWLCLIVLATLSSPVGLFAQKVRGQDPELSRIRAEKARAAKDAEQRLPKYLRKMGPQLRSLLQRMQADGITRQNAKLRRAEQYSQGSLFQVDTLGAILMELSVRDLQCETVESLESLGVVISGYHTRNGLQDKDAVEYFRAGGVVIGDEYLGMHGTLECRVPCDAVEEVAKMESVHNMMSTGIFIKGQTR